jgi:hypothetical protein
VTAKITGMTQKIALLWHQMAERCITCPSQSQQSFGKFGYTFIFKNCRHRQHHHHHHHHHGISHFSALAAGGDGGGGIVIVIVVLVVFVVVATAAAHILIYV